MGQDRQQQLRRARLVAGVAATIISLACGTNVSHPPSSEAEFLRGAVDILLGFSLPYQLSHMIHTHIYIRTSLTYATLEP